MVHQMRGKPPNGYKCSQCGSSAHFSRSDKCRAKLVKCRHCKGTGHYPELCKFRRDRAPAQNPPAPKKRSASVQPQNPPIVPAPLTSKTEMLFGCTIGNRRSHVKIDETSAVNIISASEHLKLIHANVCRRTSEIVKKLSIDNKEFKGVFVAPLKVANGEPAYVNFFIREGEEEFAMITKKLAKEMKIPEIGNHRACDGKPDAFL